MKCRPCGLQMPEQADGAFLCPGCGAVVRLSQFTGGAGPTILTKSLPPDALDGRVRRKTPSPESGALDLGIAESLNGQLA